MKNNIKNTLYILGLAFLILFAMTTIVKAEEEFSLTETSVTMYLNRTKYLAYQNKPIRRKYNLDK